MIERPVVDVAHTGIQAVGDASAGDEVVHPEYTVEREQLAGGLVLNGDVLDQQRAITNRIGSSATVGSMSESTNAPGTSAERLAICQHAFDVDGDCRSGQGEQREEIESTSRTLLQSAPSQTTRQSAGKTTSHKERRTSPC